MIEKKMLFTPGPVMTSEAVKAVLLQPDIPHRQRVFEQYVRRIRESLLRLSGADGGTTAGGVTGAAVRKALAEHAAIGWVCMVYHETSTGMRNPVGAVGALTADAGRRLFVDCVSAIGGEPLGVVRDRMHVA